jgi:hypothetical protein
MVIRWAKPEKVDEPVTGMDMVEVFPLFVVLINMAKNLMALVPYRNTSNWLDQRTIKGCHCNVFVPQGLNPLLLDYVQILSDAEQTYPSYNLLVT